MGKLIQKLKGKINSYYSRLNEINNGNDKKIFEKNSIIILTSTSNQKNNENENNITMDLGECENILKDDYNICTKDIALIIGKSIKQVNRILLERDKKVQSQKPNSN